MEHSVEAYLERMSAEELEAILRRCVEDDQAIQYAHLLPLLQKMLLSKQKG